MSQQEMTHTDKAWTNPDSPLKKELDFAPFSAELATLTDARITTIDAMLLNATVVDIQGYFAEGVLTSAELTLYYLHRIQKYDPDKLNSVLTLNPDALTIAQQRDAERSQSPISNLYSLHGIPILLKDNVGTGDQMPVTAGAAVLADHHSDRDAFIVMQLREAGAVIIGKTNLSEWAYFMNRNAPSGYSALGGHTRNGYGRFDAGGSSSGSGVAVAANFATLAIGTETAGSLVYPASQNSIYTLKPSLGLISRDRIIPITAAQDTAGPMTRTVADLATLLNAIAGVDSRDPLAQETASIADTDFTQFLDPDGLQGVRIGVVLPEMNEQFAADYAEYNKALFDNAIAALEAAGATVKQIMYEPAGVDYLDVLFMGMKHDFAEYLEMTDAPVKTVGDVVAFNNENLEERAWYKQELLEQSAENSATRAQYDIIALTNRRQTRRHLQLQLKLHKVDMFISISNWATREYAPAGTPAVNIPMGYRPSGEPQSITLFGDFLDDGKLIAAAYAFEQATDLRRAPDLDAWSR